MIYQNDVPKKPSARVSVDEKLLVSRQEAAQILSIGLRSLDYLVANKQLAFRRIGSRILIAMSDLQRFARADHPERLAS
jgi:excisionase family DNA binding protein